MRTDKLVLVFFASAMIALFIVSIRTKQGEKLYDRRGENAVTWYWLRALGIPRTRANCVRFSNLVSCVAIALIILGTTAALFFGK